MKTAYDAAFPPPVPPVTDVVCVYGAPGDPLHTWTAQEIAAQPARYRLPIFVRSNPKGEAEATIDANAFAVWLASVGCPPGCAVMLDLEEAVTAPYVLRFGQVLAGAGHPVLPYGPRSTLFKNPALAGYFVAWPGYSPGIPAGCVAVQYAQGPGARWDLDLIDDSVSLWDTRSPVPPAPQPQGGIAMIAFDSRTKGTWGVKVDGSVYAYTGAPYLGGLNNHPEWHAGSVGTVAGIAEWPGDGTTKGGNGYVIFVETPTQFALYRFPGDGSLRG